MATAVSEDSGLPAGWRWKSLGDALPLEYGKALPAKARTGEGGTTVYGSSGPVGEHSASFLKGPAVIVGRKGSAGAVHYCAGPCWPIDTAYFVRHGEDVDPRFAYFLLTSLRLDKLDQSTAIPSLSRDTYGCLVAPFPEIDVQRRIVDRIDELFSEIDDGEEELRRARAELETYRQSLLKAAVTGELTADWRAANPSKESGADLLQRILADRRSRWEAEPRNRGKAYKEPVAAETDGLPELPPGWAWATADMLSEAGKGHIVIGPFGSDLKVSDYRPEGVPLIFVRNIRAGIYDNLKPKFIPLEKAIQLKAHVVTTGDILVTKMGEPPGDADVYPSDQPDAVITADCIRWRPSAQINRGFCRHWINSLPGSLWIQRVTKGVAQQKISLGTFKRMPVPVPPADEAERLLALVGLSLSASEDLSNINTCMTNRSAILRQSILAAAFRGELVQ